MKSLSNRIILVSSLLVSFIFLSLMLPLGVIARAEAASQGESVIEKRADPLQVQGLKYQLNHRETGG